MRELECFYRDRKVGKLVAVKGGKYAFAYGEGWLDGGFSISPFSLPLEEGVFVPKNSVFDGLFGVFADCLPDSWGRLLLSRYLREKGVDEGRLNMLDRLSFASGGVGALSFRPSSAETETGNADMDFDELAAECLGLLKAKELDEKDLDFLRKMAGSSGGARPKINVSDEGRVWLVKFPAHVDGDDIGVMEYEYNLCAADCGIDLPRTKLFPSKKAGGYFASERFDRGASGSGIHMISAAGVLEADFRSPCLDYNDLMKLTRLVTANNAHDLEQMYRRMCFNVFAHNRDDHAKNFAYLYDEASGFYRLSPAYDLTFSSTYYGEHTTSVNGNGKNPGVDDLIAVGVKGGLSGSLCREIAGQIEDKTKQLDKWV